MAVSSVGQNRVLETPSGGTSRRIDETRVRVHLNHSPAI